MSVFLTLERVTLTPKPAPVNDTVLAGKAREIPLNHARVFAVSNRHRPRRWTGP